MLDWSTLGSAPVGADAAHLALSVRADLLGEYVAGLDGAYDAAEARTGYAVTLALTAASRAHWTVSRGRRWPRELTELACSAAGL